MNEIEFEDYKSFINKHLAPCIANLGVLSAQDDYLCRKFNYPILLKTKGESSQVRSVVTLAFTFFLHSPGV